MFQNTTLIGNVGQEPQIKYTNSGIPVCNFSLAVNEGWTAEDGQRHERTVWIRVTCWRALAETVAEYVKKGRQVMVSGKLTETRPWIDQEGNPRADIEVTANIVQFLGSASDGVMNNNSNATPADGMIEDAYAEGYKAALAELTAKAQQKQQPEAPTAEVVPTSAKEQEPEPPVTKDETAEASDELAPAEAGVYRASRISQTEEPKVEDWVIEEPAVEDASNTNQQPADEPEDDEEHSMILNASAMLNGEVTSPDQPTAAPPEPANSVVDEDIPF